MRRALTVVLALGCAFAAVPASADNVAVGFTWYCDGKASRAIGEGSASQIRVHSEIFIRTFNKVCKREANRVSYLGIADRSGINAILNRTRPFGTADVPLTPAEKLQVEISSKGQHSPVHQIPLYVGGYAIAYNVPCAGPPIRFRSKVLGLIYAGVITRWDHDLLRQDNPWLQKCGRSIRLTRRADQAGSTAVVQDYLAKRNPEWVPFRQGVAGEEWPTLEFACAGLGDRGMVNCISSVNGAIGYVSIAAARQSRLLAGKMENATGTFVDPLPANCTTAADTAVPPPGTSEGKLPDGQRQPWVPATLGDWSTVSITDARDQVDATGKTKPSYPICSFSFAFVLQNWFGGYNKSQRPTAARTVVDYFTVALRDATQNLLTAAGYGPLPPRIRQIGRDGINSVSFYGQTTVCGITISTPIVSNSPCL